MAMPLKLILAGFILLALLICFGYLKNQNSFFIATGPDASQGSPSVLVKAGQSGSRLFHWLPSKQHYGATLADSGLSKDVFLPKHWDEFQSKAIHGNLKTQNYAISIVEGLQPYIKHLLKYAYSNSEEELMTAWAEINQNSILDVEHFFRWLKPIANGNQAELSLFHQTLETNNPKLVRVALDFGIDLAIEKQNIFLGAVIKAYESPNTEIQKIALSAVSELPSHKSARLFQPKESANNDSENNARIAEESTKKIIEGSANKQIRSVAQREIAELLSNDANRAYTLLNGILMASAAAKVDKVWSIDLLASTLDEEGELAKVTLPGVLKNIDSDNKALAEKSQLVLARLSPKDALEIIIAKKIDTQSSDVTTASLLGVIAEDFSDNEIVKAGLSRLYKSSDPQAQGLALEGMGYTNLLEADVFKSQLTSDSKGVMQGAAIGLVRHSIKNQSLASHLPDLLPLKKGDSAQQRAFLLALKEASETSPGMIFDHLTSAATDSEKSELKKIALDAICNAALQKHPDAIPLLKKMLRKEKPPLQRKTFSCFKKSPKTLSGLAPSFLKLPEKLNFDDKLVKLFSNKNNLDFQNTDHQNVIRALLKSPNSVIRLKAIKALSKHEEKAPEAIVKDVERLYNQGDLTTKTAVLSAVSTLGLNSLFKNAIVDPSSYVRIFALDKVMGSSEPKQDYLSIALSDKESSVQTNALEHLVASEQSYDTLNRYLVRAIANDDAFISGLAMTAYVKSADPSEVIHLLENDFLSPDRIRRLNATQACITLAPKEPQAVYDFLTSRMSDEDSEIRRQAYTGAAIAKSHLLTVQTIESQLEKSEANATERMLALGALLASTDPNVNQSFERMIKKGPPWAAFWSQIALKLQGRGRQALTFISYFLS